MYITSGSQNPTIYAGDPQLMSLLFKYKDSDFRKEKEYPSL